MHIRNPYRAPPPFDALARSYPPLLAHLHGRTIDFNDDAAQRCLTQALLKRDFGLELHLPSDRLCPPDIVGDLRKAVPFVFGNLGSAGCTVRGLDVGTGASAIYPLLACSLEPTWKFIATELDKHSYEHAQANIRVNKLLDRIHLVKVEAGGLQDSHEGTSTGIQELCFNFEALFRMREEEKDGTKSGNDELIAKPDDAPTTRTPEIHFTMCNPPFYSSDADVANSEAMKESSAFGASAPVEMITPGGESHFVKVMIRESLRDFENSAGHDHVVKRRRTEDGETRLLGEKSPNGNTAHQQGLCWYTSMLGKMASVVEIVETFKERSISNYAITEFVQGQTRRWAVGWCVGGWRLRDDITRIANPNPTLQRLLPSRNSLHFDLHITKIDAQERLISALRGIEGAQVMAVENNTDASHAADEVTSSWSCVVAVAGDTWSRSARRKQKRKREREEDASGSGRGHDSPSNSSKEPTYPALVCALVLRDGDHGDALADDAQNRIQTRMEVQWVYGHDRSLLESFASHVARRITTENVTALAG
ncbi:hypothetical protein H0H92_000219 [Tricholoma furcatifolium]|nr:hypothetical protein H0H92_000219 [Tricholoma furcatifolium]